MNIVSGFISNVNRRADRDITKYIHFGMELMAVEIPMTIFIERLVFDSHILPRLGYYLSSLQPDVGEFLYTVRGGLMDGIQQIYSYRKIGHITFVFFETDDLFLWSSRALAVRKFALNTGNPNKDTLEYMMVQCQKTEWMAIASSQLCENPSREVCKGMGEYIWIDFGAFHMFQGKIDVFQTELYKLRSRVNRNVQGQGQGNHHIRIARCWDPNHIHYGDIYRDVNWLFAGSVFGGSVVAIDKFAAKMREKCIQIMREKNTLMWEINIWVLIYRESPELFSLYPSDHSEILFRGY
jgi:hypothetical protein